MNWNGYLLIRKKEIILKTFLHIAELVKFWDCVEMSKITGNAETDADL